MKSSLWIAVLFAIASVVWIASGQFGGSDASTAEAQAEKAPKEAPLPRVRVIDSKATLHQQMLTINGHTSATRMVRLRAETDGRIEEIVTQKGRPVRKDDIIARIALDDREQRRQEAIGLLRQREVEFSAAKQLSAKGFRSDTSLAQAQALLDAARAGAARINTDIANTTIRAPFDGVLNDRMVEIGTYVQSGDDVAHLVDLNPVLVVIDVAERYIGALAIGQETAVATSTGEKRQGMIRYIGAVANAATRTFPVEIELANPDLQIFDGLTASVTLPVERVMAHFVTPAILTLNEAGQIGVKTVGADDVVTFQPVRIVSGNASGVWLAGLPEALRVIVVGQEFVAAGQKVVTEVAEDFAATPPSSAPGIVR
ncbi:MAG: efflux RND transporter periplasmic adaptor subunit [Alphaproteobacteria bacterium]|nr:efflux RND transporter periplasmic adaptor subunit [Alphaproteobacteria bacterium]MBU0796266.1 efflux RND transporter periplasmic adaptor subunit [Alphaproteobacteria bacterium]MBU0887477.1 efflux RND transporter periplasmic adaptor subunit [Alphaproteobacteria bacterium]MBU1813314.1 efflux RND transporter periplasmic adaptor subunit [Alphaproteobacteria bacterium]MBU2092045.1 efflux RND transporter periplasmic adaptor subunit [Alphaproteobacteria bacterium]